MSNFTSEGNLVRDVDLRFLPDGETAVAEFSIAENRRWTDASGKLQERTSFYDCKLWGEPGKNLAASVAKGDMVLVVGNVEQERWVDEKTQTNRSKLVVRCQSVGVSVRFAQAKPMKLVRTGNGIAEVPSDGPIEEAPDGAEEAPF